MSFQPLHPGVNRAFAARAAPWFWPANPITATNY